MFDVVGVGNALVDVQARVSDAFLADHGLAKGGMQLVDNVKAAEIYDAMPPAQEASGGSVANSMAVVAWLGGKAAFIGRVANDELGDVFAHDMKAAGISCAFVERDAALPTGRSLIAVTEDGERTMSTSLGCNLNFTPADVDKAIVEAGQYVFLEGYLFDQAGAKQAYYHAAKVAKAAGRKVALSLSDAFCVNRHHEDFVDLVKNQVDLLFANESEIIALTKTADFESAIAAIRGQCETLVITQGDKGAWLATAGEEVRVPAITTGTVVDLTGAGDAFAGGVLYGLTQSKTLAEAGQYGALAAAEVISHFGARPQANCQEFLAFLANQGVKAAV